MLHETLATRFGLTDDCLAPERMEQFKNLYSQTSVPERAALYAVSRYVYTGSGEIYDIGVAAGGSSYCMAAGVLDSSLTNKEGRVHCFDIFGGYSTNCFADRLSRDGLVFRSDIEFFDWQTKNIAPAIIRKQVNLDTEPEVLMCSRKVEIAHIDAAKTLRLWQAIFGGIAHSVIPGKTIWIFQDFERIRLPWQIYGLFELLKVGDLIGGAPFGTMYFRFKEKIPQHIITKITSDDFSLDERIENVEQVFDIIDRDYMSLFIGEKSMDDFRAGVKAYCYYWAGEVDKARTIFCSLSSSFLSKPGSSIYLKEIGNGP